MHPQECLSNYELSIVPRSLFAADSTMLHCSAKSILIDILKNMSSAETSIVTPPEILQPNKCVAVIDTVGVTIVPEYGVTPKTRNSDCESQNTI